MSLFGSYDYVEMKKFLTINNRLLCRSSTGAQLRSVHGRLYSMWSTATYSRWCLRGWRIRRGIFSQRGWQHNLRICPPTPLGLVRRRSLDRFLGVLSRPNLETAKHMGGLFGRPVLTGLSPRKPHVTYRVDMCLRHSSPLASWVLAVLAAAASISLRATAAAAGSDSEHVLASVLQLHADCVWPVAGRGGRGSGAVGNIYRMDGWSHTGYTHGGCFEPMLSAWKGVCSCRVSCMG